MTQPTILAVSTSRGHHFSKQPALRIRLLEGLGVEGDAHAGTTVKHRSRVRVDPTQPNLRQVHLLHAEAFDELRPLGFNLAPGAIGENVTTSGIDLLALPRGTLLHLGATSVVEVTGLRNPCVQLDNFQKGLMAAFLGRDTDGRLLLKAGIMAIVRAGGDIGPGDTISVELPPQPYIRMERV